jgi:Tfp pilus assembly protein PilV
MKSVNRNQSGFSTVEIILIIVIVGAIGLVGWFVYHTKQNSDKTLNQATSTSQNAGPRFAKPKESKAKPSSTSNQ